MSTSTLTYRRSSSLTLMGDYLELTKPRIAVLELITVAVAAWVARSGLPEPWLMLHGLLGTALVAASASVLNQWIEIARDARMNRTADRPLPSGRVSSREAVCFGVVLFGAGMLWLFWKVNALTALMGFVSWLLYVVVYTPLKTRSEWNTAVGAVAGAMPVLMGWSAVGGKLGLAPAVLFLMVFLWQFPHFMAIAWMYRRDYAEAGMKMLPVVDPSGRRAGRQAVMAAVALLPVSLLPAVVHFAGPWYMVVALLTGLGQVCFSGWFFLRMNEESARGLLRMSLVYLPVVFFWLLVGPLL